MTYTIDDKSIVLIDVKKNRMTIDEFNGKIYQFRTWPQFRDMEIFLDSETMTIRAKDKVTA